MQGVNVKLASCRSTHISDASRIPSLFSDLAPGSLYSFAMIRFLVIPSTGAGSGVHDPATTGKMRDDEIYGLGNIWNDLLNSKRNALVLFVDCFCTESQQ